jgi:hypothetical protein
LVLFPDLSGAPAFSLSVEGSCFPHSSIIGALPAVDARDILGALRRFGLREMHHMHRRLARGGELFQRLRQQESPSDRDSTLEPAASES